MKRYILSTVLVLVLVLVTGTASWALLDQFEGDAAIYSATSQYLRPNVLLVIDNSAGMRQAGSRDPYDPDTDYTYAGAAYSKDEVYERKAATGGTINYVGYIDDVNTDVTCSTAKTALLENGYYAGTLKKNDGSCNASQGGNYFLGNLLNYIDSPSSTPTWQANTVYAVGDKIKPTAAVTDSNGTPLEYEVVGFTVAAATSGISDASEPTWPTAVGDTVVDGTVKWGISGSIIDMVKTTVKQVVAGARDSVNFGVMVFGNNNQGGQILAPVQELGVDDADGPTNYAALVSAVDDISLLSGNSQPVNETFWDASLYFSGQNDSSSKISSDLRLSIADPVQLPEELHHPADHRQLRPELADQAEVWRP